jgi:hypothetical protein
VKGKDKKSKQMNQTTKKMSTSGAKWFKSKK